VDWARKQPGVTVISLSWGAKEHPGQSNLNSFLTTPAGHTGITFVASSGDFGAVAEFPGTSANVVSVGGTDLIVDAGGTYTGEIAWSKSGGGPSRFEKAAAYQQMVSNSERRIAPDVSYNSGTFVAIVCTVPSTGQQQWLLEGGTSAGAPQWAGLFAITNQLRVAGGAHTLDGASQTLPALYSPALAGDFHDITTGSNGFAAGPGFDVATGLGTPHAEKVIQHLAQLPDTVGGVAVAVALTPPANVK
jgi:subtilase family serine protease